jgi:hypothetical protein
MVQGLGRELQKMALLPHDIQQGLIAEHERDEGEGLKRFGSEPEPKARRAGAAGERGVSGVVQSGREAPSPQR